MAFTGLPKVDSSAERCQEAGLPTASKSYVIGCDEIFLSAWIPGILFGIPKSGLARYA